MTKKNTVTPEEIVELLERAVVERHKMGEKTLVVTATLENGFVLTEASSCVDPANFDEEIGTEIALGKIQDRLWELEGYRLQQQLFEEAHHAE